MATDTAPAPVARKPKTWDPTRHLWQWPALILGLAAFLAVWMGIVPLQPSPNDQLERTLVALRSQLESGLVDAATLGELLNSATMQASAASSPAPNADYLLGSGYLRLAELQSDTDQARQYAQKALTYLERVNPESLPSPSAEKERLAFRQAKARAAASNDPQATSTELARQLLYPPEGEPAGEAFRLAAEIFLRLSPPALVEARQAYERYLRSASLAAPPATIARAKLRLGEILLALNDTVQARQWLEQIKPDAPESVLQPARVQLARLAMQDHRWAEAARLWEQVLGSSEAAPMSRSEVVYQLGLCQERLGQAEEAARLFDEAAQSSGPERFAALVKRLDLALAASDPEAKKLAALRLAQGLAVLPSADAATALLPLHEIQASVEQALKMLAAQGEFPTAMSLVEAYPVVANPRRAQEQKAELLAEWGAALKKQKGDFAGKFIAAAKEYLALADAADLPVSLKAERLRRAAQAYQEAQDREGQLEVLSRLVTLTDVPEAILGPALLEYAEVLLAHRQPEHALAYFQKAMQSPSVGMAARYKLARTLIDSGDAQRQALGMDLLRQIGQATEISPGEQEYRERALVELGQEALRAGRYAEAEAIFRKQLSFHPNGAEALMARFLLGVCLLQQTARPPGTPDQPEDPKMRREALDLFRSVIAEIDAQRNRTGQMSDRELWLRTQSSLRVLQALQQMERLGEVIATAAVVRRDCEGKVEELIALSMMYHAQKQANHPELALRVLDEMREVFRHLPDSAYHGSGEYSKEYWERVWFNPASEGTATTPAPVAPLNKSSRGVTPAGGNSPSDPSTSPLGRR